MTAPLTIAPVALPAARSGSRPRFGAEAGAGWNRVTVVCALVLASVYLFEVLRDAWLCDDVFITLRTVDNWVQGRGLTWNPGFRVQTFTHPLWMLLLAAARLVTGEVYYSTLFLSVAVSCASLFVLVRWHGIHPLAVLLVLAALSASKSWVDFSTSGLENPLTHLLLVLAYGVLWRPGSGPRKLFVVSLLAGLAGLNRLDSLLLILPAVAVAAVRTRSAGALRGAASILLGFVPLLAWLAFSLAYYGFALPNTYYAKVPADIPTSSYFLRAWTYFGVSALFDPLAPALILAAVVASLVPRGRHLLPASIGIVAWLAYLFRIGGDYMVGRHLAAPLVLAAIVLARFPRLPRPAVLVGVSLVLLAGACVPTSPWRVGRDYSFDWMVERMGENQHVRGYMDERSFYYPTTGLFRPERSSRDVEHPWSMQGRKWRPWFDSARRRPMVLGPVGMASFFAGPRAHVVDTFALTDPLLSRLPAHDPTVLFTGHCERDIPEGYLDSLFTGENRLVDPDLARYWSRLSVVVTGDLWSTRRLRSIWDVHFGEARASLEAYRRRREVEQRSMFSTAASTESLSRDAAPPHSRSASRE